LNKKKNLLSPSQIKCFQIRLAKWYKQNHRELPWRKTHHPYYIWVSEVMLQQTQVTKVTDYYPQFIKKFPNIRSLARADLTTILKEWELLGYYARARNLHKAAKILVKSFKGKIPAQYEEFKQLPGVGDYIAAAVMSIAYNLPFPVLDGNVKRVIARMFLLNTPVNKAHSIKDFREFVWMLLDRQNPGEFNQGMMELGAIICKTRHPLCRCCPVHEFCLAFQNKKVQQYPKKEKKSQIPEFHIAVGIIQKNGTILITQRKFEGLLGGLWEFPGGKIQKGESPPIACLREIEEEVNLVVEIAEHLTQMRHTYTHFKIVMDVFLCRYVSGEVQLRSAINHRWIDFSEIENYPFPGANHKFFPILKSALTN